VCALEAEALSIDARNGPVLVLHPEPPGREKVDMMGEHYIDGAAHDGGGPEVTGGSRGIGGGNVTD
jgi:hypothetical protein